MPSILPKAGDIVMTKHIELTYPNGAYILVRSDIINQRPLSS